MNHIFYASKIAIKENKKFFISVFIIAVLAFTFLTNTISIYGIIYYQQILVPENAGVDAPIFIILFSFLLSLSLTLHKYKLKLSKGMNVLVHKKEKHLSLLAGFAGIFSSACPICPPLVLSLIGIPAASAVFPLGGWEARAAAIALLLVSIHFVSKGIMNTGVCK